MSIGSVILIVADVMLIIISIIFTLKTILSCRQEKRAITDCWHFLFEQTDRLLKTIEEGEDMTPIELKDAVKNDKGVLTFERGVIVIKKDKTTEAIPEEEYLKKVKK